MKTVIKKKYCPNTDLKYTKAKLYLYKSVNIWKNSQSPD